MPAAAGPASTAGLLPPVPLPGSTAATSPLSACGLHELALEAFRIGNRGRLSLCEVLRVLHETRLYLDLGFPSLAAYAGVFFQLRRAETFEHVRVARALVELSELREAFAQGRLGWSAVKAITRVASADSQAVWIEFAGRNGIERTLAEAQDALRRGRDRPGGSSFGLPNLEQKLVLRFSRSDMERVRTWLEAAGAAVTAKTGADEVSAEQAILFLCESAAAGTAQSAKPGAAAGPGDGGRAKAAVVPAGGDPNTALSRTRVVYQRCPDCRRARVGTRDGFVEVPAEELERHEGCAEPVAIDGPTPRGLRRRVLAREAGRCGNPRCHHRADHCHHIVFRSRGGRTELANEVAVCGTCHALIHAGLLRVQGRGDGELRWLPVAAPVERRVGAAPSDRAAAERLPVLRLEVPHPRSGDGSAPDRRGPESAIADSQPRAAAAARDAATGRALDPHDLAGALARLGVGLARARRVIDTAIAALPGGECTEAAVLRKALASL